MIAFAQLAPVKRIRALWSLPLEVLSPRERDSLIAFLSDVFHLPNTAAFLNPDLLSWKYDEPRPDWPGSRSYAWMEQGAITAHACLYPATYRAGDQDIAASYLIDWAAGRRLPGAGVLLLRKLASFFPVLLAIGGSEDTLRILPKLGYRTCGEISSYARVMRPWRQFRTDPFPRGWKGPLRLARNVLRSLEPVRSAPKDWSAQPIAAFEDSHAALLAAETPFPSTHRTPALLNYLLRCPGARMSAYLIHREGRACGWFMLARVPGVVRIADLRVQSSEPEWWQAAYDLATQIALADPEGCELVAAASTPLAADAIRNNGFRLYRSDPIFLLDPKGLLANRTPLEVSLLDSDAAYLYVPGYPYLT